MGKLKIAIDGPSGVGKSTVADGIAKALGIHHLNTGALYRAFGYGCNKLKLNLNDEKEIVANIPNVVINVEFEQNGEQLNYVNGELVNDKIFTNEVALQASLISTYGEVRHYVVSKQREIADKYDIVLEGRDICEVVLPDANFKFFLNADVNIRAERVTKMYQEKGQNITYEEVLNGLINRDHNDTTRKISPLRKAHDAVEIDTCIRTTEPVIEECVKIIKGE